MTQRTPILLLTPSHSSFSRRLLSRVGITTPIKSKSPLLIKTRRGRNYRIPWTKAVPVMCNRLNTRKYQMIAKF